MELRIKLFALSMGTLLGFSGCSVSAIIHDPNGLSYYMQSDLCDSYLKFNNYAVCYDSTGNYTTTIAPIGQQQADLVIKQQAAENAAVNNSIQMMNQTNQNTQMQMLNNNMMLLNNKLLLGR